MPDWREEVRSAISGLNLEPAREAEIIEELSQHLADRREEMLASGQRADAVDQTLLREVKDGALTSGLKATTRLAPPSQPIGRNAGEHLFERVWIDLRYGARLLLQNPGFSLVVILSLALGIGGNAAIFQLLNAVRLRSLPVLNPGGLATVRIVDSPRCCRGNFYSDHSDLTGGLWNQVREKQEGFAQLAAWFPWTLNLGHGGEAHHVDTLMVSGNFFSVLGVQPSMGRLISVGDDYRGCGAEGAVVSYGFWQREYGGSREVLDQKVTLDGHPFQVMGVAPPSFHGLEVGRNFDVAIPLCSEPLFFPKGSLMDSPISWWLTSIGRLKPGWNAERASAQLRAISPGIFAATVPAEFDETARKDYLSFRFGAVSAASGFSTLREEYQKPLWLLLALSGLVLLIACANLANLMLARASARQREMALRLTLGASRSRLIRQLLTESLLLAGLGAAAGAALGYFLGQAIIGFLSTQEDRIFLELTPDWRVLAFLTGLAALACILFGLIPAIQSSRSEPSAVLKASGRGLSASGESLSLRRILVVSQVALSLVLLIGALLFVRTFLNLVAVNAGFREDHVLIASFDYTPLRLPNDSQMEFKHELLRRLQSIPGVDSAAEALITPFAHMGWDDNVDIPDGERRQDVLFNRVSPGYFRTIEVPLLAGRDFNSADVPEAPRKAIVNQTFAKRFFAGSNALGKTFWDSGKPDRMYQIIGIAKDSKYRSVREEASPLVFVSYTQANGPEPTSTFVIRSEEALPSLISSVKAMAGKVNPAMVLNFSVLETQVQEGLLRERLIATLSGFFGGLATLLAMIGLYGVVSYLVVKRKSEIGLRMALGAGRASILAMVLREAGILLGIGLAVGAALALGAGNVVASMLYGLKPRDPLTILMAMGAMAVVALLASVLPARRAAAVDPMKALREE